MQNEVKNYEPLLALDGGEDGLDFYRIIANNYKDFLSDNGIILMEVGINQAVDVASLFKSAKSTEIISDLEGVDRIVKVII